MLHATSWQQTYRGVMPDAFLDGDVFSNRQKVWRQRLAQDRPDQFVCLAEDNQVLVGFICAFGEEDSAWGSYIDNLHVARERKRAGIGSALMKAAAEWLNTHYPQIGVYLWVMETNYPARRFYEHLGASTAETLIKKDPGGGSAPNCRYTWPAPIKILAR